MGIGGKFAEKQLGKSIPELIKYLDSVHARLEVLNEQMETLTTQVKRIGDAVVTRKRSDRDVHSVDLDDTVGGD